MLYKYNGIRPIIEPQVYIAPTAAVVGDVKIGQNSSVWFNAVIRGDAAPVRIGIGTSIQDNACVHDRTIIGNGVTVGHSAIIHACTVGDDVLVGMGAAILDGAVIGEGAVIAAGAVIKVGTIVPPRTLFAGNPAVWKKDIDEQTVRQNQDHARHYCQRAAEYLLL
jgi:carbonic anhydrase/acetyltransferase-like protein (isoleucine patch superfamily)